MAEILVVVSKVKKIGKDADLRTGGDFIEALSAKVESMVKASIAKVKAEGKKKTLQAVDLVSPAEAGAAAAAVPGSEGQQ